MPIDPRIALSVEPFRLNSPFARLGEMREQQQRQQLIGQQIRRSRAAEEKDQQDIAKQAAAEAAQAKFFDIIRRAKDPDDADALIRAEVPELYQPYQEQRQKLETTAADLRTKALTAQKLQAEIAKAGQEYAAPYLQMVEKSGYDPAVFNFALTSIEGQGFPVDQLRQQGQGGPEAIKAIIDGFKSPQQQNADREAATAAVERPGKIATAEIQQQVAAGTVGGITPAQQLAAKPKTLDAALLAAMQAKDGAEVRRILNLKREDAAATRAPAGAAAQEPLVPIIGPDGQPVLVPRSQAAGKRPASTREQGRNVTAGDAADLADFDTSLDDLKVLRAALTETKDATGFRAQVTAAVPYLASAAKNRQAVIDRVKQVIGKTLEGGVLRKEDEAKYEKILPTIKDPPSVAAAKIDGLEKAIALRKQRRLDNLGDANYDVSKQTERGKAPASAGGIKILKIEEIP